MFYLLSPRMFLKRPKKVSAIVLQDARASCTGLRLLDDHVSGRPDTDRLPRIWKVPLAVWNSSCFGPPSALWQSHQAYIIIAALWWQTLQREHE